MLAVENNKHIIYRIRRAYFTAATGGLEKMAKKHKRSRCHCCSYNKLLNKEQIISFSRKNTRLSLLLLPNERIYKLFQWPFCCFDVTKFKANVVRTKHWQKRVRIFWTMPHFKCLKNISRWC